MIYTKTIKEEITFFSEDIITWAKTFSAKQMGIDISSIEDEWIKIDKDNFIIKVSHTKVNGNGKHEVACLQTEHLS